MSEVIVAVEPSLKMHFQGRVTLSQRHLPIKMSSIAGAGDATRVMLQFLNVASGTHPPLYSLYHLILSHPSFVLHPILIFSTLSLKLTLSLSLPLDGTKHCFSID